MMCLNVAHYRDWIGENSMSTFRTFLYCSVFMQCKGANRQTVDLKICLRDDCRLLSWDLVDGKDSSDMGRVAISKFRKNVDSSKL